ncbi:hypothetical protein ACRAWF_31385 [Streptomyces sp. L7]
MLAWVVGPGPPSRRKDSGSHAELRKIASPRPVSSCPAGLADRPRADDRVGRAEPANRVPPTGPPRRTPAARAGERGPGQKVTGGDISALRSVGELLSGHSTTPTAAATPGRPSCATWSTRPNRCCAAPTANRPAAACSRRRPTSPGLAGWTSYDIAAHARSPQRYFVQALRLSQAAGDRAYGSYVLMTTSRQAVYLGHGREAVQLARVAQQGSGPAAPPVVQARCCTPSRRGRTGCSGRCGRAPPRLCGPSAPRSGAGRGRSAVLGRGSSTRRSSPTSSGTRTGTFSSSGSAAPARGALAAASRAPAPARSRLSRRVVLASARLGLGELDRGLCAGRGGGGAGGGGERGQGAAAIEYVRDPRAAA